MDLGFIQPCYKQLNNTNYTIIEANIPFSKDKIFNITTYQGFCFNDVCPTTFMN